MGYCRLNPRQTIFFKTACDFASKSIEKLNKYKAYEKDKFYDAVYFELSSIVNNNACYSIIFLCLGLEAFIYDYGARSLGDNYVKKYLDKLDIVSKFVIYPRLITGKELRRESKHFAVVKKMIGIRNEFVHSKSKCFDVEVYTEKDITDFVDRVDIVACFFSTIELIKEVYSLSVDPDSQFIMQKELEELERFVNKK